MKKKKIQTKQPGAQREFLPDYGSAFFSLRKSICDRNQHGALIAHSHALLVCLFVFLFYSLQPSFLKLSSHILEFFINVVAMCGHCLFFSSSSSEETNHETLAGVVCDVKSSGALSVDTTSIHFLSRAQSREATDCKNRKLFLFLTLSLSISQHVCCWKRVLQVVLLLLIWTLQFKGRSLSFPKSSNIIMEQHMVRGHLESQGAEN